MNKIIEDYINELESLTDKISNSLMLINEQWNYENPPVNVLFLEAGKAIAKYFPVLSNFEKHSLFIHIENGMISPDHELSTSVAIGIIEPLVTLTSANKILHNEVKELFGKRSAEYAVEWEIIKNYIDKIESFSDEISKGIQSTRNDWYPENPPIIILLSEIGKIVVKNFPEIEKFKKILIFKHIEYGIASPNEKLATAVATGFIEAIIESTSDNIFLWNKIYKLLGEQSREYALAWINFNPDI